MRFLWTGFPSNDGDCLFDQDNFLNREVNELEKPINFRCKYCLCYTVIYESGYPPVKMYFTPNFCGQCGAINPDRGKVE